MVAQSLQMYIITLQGEAGSPGAKGLDGNPGPPVWLTATSDLILETHWLAVYKCMAWGVSAG